MRRPSTLPARGELERQPLRRLEHGAASMRSAASVVDVEEAPVVDLVGGDAPVREPLGLLLEQACSASSCAVGAVERFTCLDRLRERRAWRRRAAPGAT